jgi:hypothetical protein
MWHCRRGSELSEPFWIAIGAMANPEEEERAFLAELKARSGRTLGEWMAALSAQGFDDKNQAIDWLRTQGFPFARASWLERIHANGGRPIYLADREPAEASPSTGAPERPPDPPVAAMVRGGAQLEALLAAGKGYRPLFHLLEAEIRKALPGTVITARPTYVALLNPREFAAVALAASGLRLGLALGDQPFEAPLVKSRLKGASAVITHMLELTDARQVNEELMRLIVAAAARARR